MPSQSRHVYTREERQILEASFARQSHPDIAEKERLARTLNCNIIQISNWFQNHRRRIKKENKLTPINTTTMTNAPSTTTPIYQPSCAYHQPQCLCNVNNDTSSYYYYYPSGTPQYVYSNEPVYTQTMYFEPCVKYEYD